MYPAGETYLEKKITVAYSRKMPAVAIAFKTFKMFAKRYKIPLSKMVDGARVKKDIKQLKREIKAYEKKHKPVNGLFF
jgi:hypothetical protein